MRVQPPCRIRATISRQAPRQAQPPEKAQVAVKPWWLKIAPEIGVPASMPRPIVAQAMPILVPITALLGEMETPSAGMMDTIDPEKNP